jgi:hypothetical protein
LIPFQRGDVFQSACIIAFSVFGSQFPALCSRIQY